MKKKIYERPCVRTKKLMHVSQMLVGSDPEPGVDIPFDDDITDEGFAD